MERFVLWLVVLLMGGNLIFLNYLEFKNIKPLCVFNVREFAKTLMNKKLTQAEIDKRIKEAKRQVRLYVEKGICKVVLSKDAVIEGRVLDITKEVIARVR